MKNLFVFIFVTFFLFGCVNSIREVELFPMGNNNYSLYVRGNSLITNNEVKQKWYEEVNKVCPKGHTVEKVGVKKVVIGGYKKPTIEGQFKCK